jgi:hypothetical protein
MIYARGWVSHPARVAYVDVGDAGADTSVCGVCALGNTEAVVRVKHAARLCGCGFESICVRVRARAGRTAGRNQLTNRHRVLPCPRTSNFLQNPPPSFRYAPSLAMERPADAISTACGPPPPHPPSSRFLLRG